MIRFFLWRRTAEFAVLTAECAVLTLIVLGTDAEFVLSICMARRTLWTLAHLRPLNLLHLRCLPINVTDEFAVLTNEYRKWFQMDQPTSN